MVAWVLMTYENCLTYIAYPAKMIMISPQPQVWSSPISGVFRIPVNDLILEIGVLKLLTLMALELINCS